MHRTTKKQHQTVNARTANEPEFSCTTKSHNSLQTCLNIQQLCNTKTPSCFCYQCVSLNKTAAEPPKAYPNKKKNGRTKGPKVLPGRIQPLRVSLLHPRDRGSVSPRGCGPLKEMNMVKRRKTQIITKQQYCNHDIFLCVFYIRFHLQNLSPANYAKNIRIKPYETCTLPRLIHLRHRSSQRHQIGGLWAQSCGMQTFTPCSTPFKQ